MKKRIAVVTASGIGDGLIMHIASHNLRESGWEVTTFSDHLAGFGKWLASYTFSPQPPLDDIEDLFLGKFDAIFLQHDNSQKAKKIASLPLPVYNFYGSHVPFKHPPLNLERDYVCDPTKTMVENLVQAIGKSFGACSTENGLRPPLSCVFRKYEKRVAIHPTSGESAKNWPREKFLRLFDRLKKKGCEPVFIASPKERALWNAPLFSSLEALASFLYESGRFLGNDSGPGHLASYFHLPHLIIAASPSHMELWRPGWRKGKILTPPPWVSRLRATREHWAFFLTVRSVFQEVMTIHELNSNGGYN